MADIVVTSGIPTEGFALLKGHTLHIPPTGCVFTDEELMQLLPHADAVVASTALRGDVIRTGRKLKIIANYGSGYNVIDIAAAATCGIPVTNIPEVTASATAEVAIGLMLAVIRRMGEMNLRLREPNAEPLFTMGNEMGYTLRGKRLAIVGMGTIGQEVKRIAEAMGMEVTGLRRRDVTGSMQEAVIHLIQDADIVSLHCPLTEGTRNLMSREVLSHMKQGSILINTARGAVVDTEALADLLESGHLFGVGLDVFPDEPHVPQRLKACNRAVLTPHLGTNTVETRYAMAEACSKQILDALSGKEPQNIINGVPWNA